MQRDMSNKKEIIKLNDNFMYNDMMARALVQLFPQTERGQIHAWLEKLQRVAVGRAGDADVERLTIRNEYLWLLLLVMQSGILTEPFNKPPPSSTELPPVSDLMPTRIYQEVLGSSDQNFSWVDKILSDAHIDDVENSHTIRSGIAPYTFFDHQPRPLNGITCYFSVFSNRS